MPDTVEDIDHQLEHWRVRVRVARFDNNPGDMIKAQTAIDELLDQRSALVMA